MDASSSRSRAHTKALSSEETLERSPVRLDGIVVDSEGAALAGAELMVDSEFGARSDLAGRLEFEVVPHDSGVRIEIRKEGHRTYETGLGFGPGERVHLGTIVLERGATVLGRLTSPWQRLIDADVCWYPATCFPSLDEESARRYGIEEWSPGPLVDTTEDGAFRMDGVPPGECFFVAQTLGHFYAWSQVFTVRAGDRIELEIPLAVNLEVTAVAGKVLGPDRKPVPNSRITVGCRGGRGGGCHTGPDGSFAWQIENASDAWIEADDPRGRFYPSERIPIAGTQLDLELVLTEPRWLEIELRDPEGRPIQWGHVSGKAARSVTSEEPPLARGLGGFSLSPTGSSGRARVLRPLVPFELEAMAPGYRTERLGPFDPESIKDPLVLQLTRGQAVEGRVDHRGNSIAGAHVSLFPTRAYEGGWARSRNVTPADRPFVFATPVDLRSDATTDGSGRFLATSQEDGEHAIAVSADGFPVAIFGPYTWSKEAGASGIELELPLGGAIEGRVLAAPGASPAGRIVGASSRWGLAHTTMSDDEGHYRIEDLPPGEYQVRACNPPVAALQGLVGSPHSDEPSWDVIVEENETSRVDLDLRNENSVVLRGRFAFGDLVGDLSFETGASLVRPEDLDKIQYVTLAHEPLSVDGSFELKLSTEGLFMLLLFNDGWWFRVPIELARGVNELEFAPREGRIRWLASSEGVSSERAIRVQLSWSDESGRSARCHLFFNDPSDLTEVLIAPAGRIRVEQPPVDNHERTLLRAEDWILWREIEVPAGEETALELP